MLRCRRFLVGVVGLITCLFFLQLGLESWSYNGLAYHIVDKGTRVDKNLEQSVRMAIESVTTSSIKISKSRSDQNDTIKPEEVDGLPTTTKQTHHMERDLVVPDTQRVPVMNKNATPPFVKPIDEQNNSTVSPLRESHQDTGGGSILQRDTSSLRKENTTVTKKEIFVPHPSTPNKPRERLKIKPVLTPEQTLRILGNAIASLPIIPSDKVIRVVIATYFRSGSTFLGDVMQQNWKTFYHFEPLHYMSDGLRIKPNQTEEALSLLSDILRCDYNSSVVAKYLKWGSDQSHQFLFKRNRFLWVACRMQPKNCFRPDFARYICERAPIQVMKVTRLHLADIKRLVESNPDLDIRVVNLVRDPRGTISSRKVLSWCNKTSCSDFRALCSEMSSDYDAFQKLATLKPNRFYQLRYEDLSLYPEIVARNMFAALGLPYSSSVSRFLKSNTRARPTDQRDPYSTRRDSSKTPLEWRNKLILNEIKKIQIGCKNVIANYNYEFLNQTRDLKGPPPLLKIGHKPWWIKP